MRPRLDQRAIIQACWELAIQPHRVAKLSGIGCSSKTPTYFLDKSHGFNSVHGRMPSVLTGATSPTATSSTSASRATATRPRSAWGSSHTRCAAA
jgi:pyruvate/2-oxoacid:ferredoxin oxidoreductase beta subunit